MFKFFDKKEKLPEFSINKKEKNRTHQRLVFFSTDICYNIVKITSCTSKPISSFLLIKADKCQSKFVLLFRRGLEIDIIGCMLQWY